MPIGVLKTGRILLLLLLAGTALSARWIPFAPDAAPGKAQATVLAENALSLEIEIRVPGAMVQEVETKDMLNAPAGAFVRFHIPDAYHNADIGRPQLPVVKQTIGVPYGARITVEVLEGEYRDIRLAEIGIDQRMMPALAPVLKCPGERPVFVIDETTYGDNALYPASIARIENDDIMRGHRLAVIETHPIQYNPATQTIRCYTRIVLRVNFAGGDPLETRERLVRNYSPVFEDFIRRRVLNYGLYENITRDVVPLPIHYLIITHNTFQAQVNDLAYWLKQKGFKVKVANQDSISTWNVAGIEAYINAQSPEPTYLLLVGDVNGGYMPAPTGSASGKVTDLYYAETDGSGYLPDIFYGRLSVETPTHITTVVEKILKYERADLPDMALWFKKDAFLAGNDNYAITEGTHNYCTTNFMDPHSYTTYKLYEQSYGATTADVFTNVNEGRILTTMSGHGSDDGWYDGPQFTVTNVNQLTNGDKLTIATGHCCLANNFGWNSGACGGESWIRKPNGGGVGYYGSCPSTYWSEDDWLQKEWYRAIYTDSIYEHARFTLDGMYDGVYLGSTSLKQYYYEGYHVLGDPSLDLWTEVPVEMVVLYDNAVIPSSMDYTVTVSGNGSPVANALVCAWIPGQSPEMHVAEYTNASGVATLSITPTDPGDTMYVTVTAHDLIPHQGQVPVIAPSGPYITAGSRIINDGNNNQANPGETIQLGLWARNIGVDPASSVYGLLSESDDYVTMSVDSSGYGNIAAGDSALSSPYYALSIANTCPNGHNINFTVDFGDALNNNWTSNFAVTVYAPVLICQAYAISGGNGNGILEPGETANLTLTLKNTGGAAAAAVAATISTNDAYLTILTDTASYGGIPVDSTATSQTPYVLQAAPATPVPHVAQVFVDITGTGFAAADTFQLVIGPTGFYDTVEDTSVTNQYAAQGSWHRTERRSHSPTHAWWNGSEATGQYANNVNASVTTPPITLAANSVLECWNWHYLESGYDYGYIELSTDNGTNWSQLTSFNGQSAGWVLYSTTLNYPTGTEVKLRLRLDTDYSVTYEGWYVDDIRVYDPLGVAESEFDVSGLPAGAAFTGVYPNPFSTAATMSFQVAASSVVSLRVYDALGRLVSTLVNGRREPGNYTLVWQGLDDSGRKAPAGVYFIRFEADGAKQVEKTVLLR